MKCVLFIEKNYWILLFCTNLIIVAELLHVNMAMAATSINQHSFGLRVVSEVAVGGGHCILVSECGRSFGYGCNSRWEVCWFFVVVSLDRRLMFLLISLCLPTRSMINP